MTAVSALTERMVLGQLSEDLPFAVLAAAGNFIVFNFALRKVIHTGAMSYPQYVLPVIVLQVMLLGVLASVDRAARDQRSDFGIRLRTMPISTLAPLVARMLYCVFRGVIALLAALAVGYVFGFRFAGGFTYSAAFVAVVLTLTLALSLGADALGAAISGTVIAKSGAASQVLLIPQMLLVMLSTGMAPTDAFPNWIQPYVQYQPISQLTETMRGFSIGHIAAGNLTASAAWCFGLLVVFGALAVRTQRMR
ncbi:ABC transporter [Mycobacterium sp. CBMA 234]|uniref:ABC transporter permease n=1 Tax=Mycolicibacterium sp. CBMA 234 TaxID=1918495 RepID=UPI00192E592E|nr:ABC transporter permease [Mycolicibacterium sp. CBMA 234]MUL63427.1 ABC transporter [Mycolicibacterium sp. CBMA 234]